MIVLSTPQDKESQRGQATGHAFEGLPRLDWPNTRRKGRSSSTHLSLVPMMQWAQVPKLSSFCTLKL